MGSEDRRRPGGAGNRCCGSDPGLEALPGRPARSKPVQALGLTIAPTLLLRADDRSRTIATVRGVSTMTSPSARAGPRCRRRNNARLGFGFGGKSGAGPYHLSNGFSSAGGFLPSSLLIASTTFPAISRLLCGTMTPMFCQWLVALADNLTSGWLTILSLYRSFNRSISLVSRIQTPVLRWRSSPDLPSAMGSLYPGR